MQRQTKSPLRAEVYLYNLLHTRSDAARQHSWERTLALKQHLEELSGQDATTERLAKAIADGNAARQAARRLVESRKRGQLSGSEGFALIGARFFMSPLDYALDANEAARNAESGPALGGPRVMIKGHGLDHPGLHREIESHGAIVVAEDDWRGARGVTEDISTQAEPLKAIFEQYYEHEVSPRCFPLEVADAWFNEAASSVHGVVFYLPPDDDVIGWDYPRHRRRLDEQRIPHMLVRCDAADLELNAPVRDDISSFVHRLKEGR
jgi:benzoyl-CoA reductase/2-hydroxyglutaryl-CoA dehydratase subunit BcrC/BadD/HgdB